MSSVRGSHPPRVWSPVGVWLHRAPGVQPGSANVGKGVWVLLPPPCSLPTPPPPPQLPLTLNHHRTHTCTHPRSPFSPAPSLTPHIVYHPPVLTCRQSHAAKKTKFTESQLSPGCVRDSFCVCVCLFHRQKKQSKLSGSAGYEYSVCFCRICYGAGLCVDWLLSHVLWSFSRAGIRLPKVDWLGSWHLTSLFSHLNHNNHSWHLESFIFCFDT